MTMLLTAITTNAKTLVVYYSFTNNVHTIVSDLSTQINADVIRVEPAEKGIDYAADNYAAGSALISAIRNNPDDPASYPAIDPVEVNLEDYDMVIVAAPLWWSQMAAPLQTFLFQYGKEMADKHIALIVSSASSGISNVVADAKRLIPEGLFLEPNLWIRSSQVSNCHSMIGQWLIDLDYTNIVSAISAVNRDGEEEVIATYDLTGRNVTSGHQVGGIIISHRRQDGKVYSKKSIAR
ncbi:MAG: flavodoxin [Muribaculaceae bacterium]